MMGRRGVMWALVGLAAWTGRAALGAGTLAGPVTDAEVGAALTRAAMLDLGLRESPGPLDYDAAGTLLRTASAYRPDDAELARLVLTSAWLSGDQELLLEATRTIVRTDPADTVAQLRLISANINARQTVEERLAAYERFLGPAGRTLDVSVRSRLALDSALLLREGGDTAGFERRLREAVDLDPTNKDAVSMATRLFSSGDASVSELAAWQVRLLNADPLDPRVHATLATICAGQGAIDVADRFLQNAIRLFMINDVKTPDDLNVMSLSFVWQRRGGEALLAQLNPQLKDRRDARAREIELRLENGEPINDLLKPEEIRFSEPIDRLRVLAAHSVGDEETVTAAMADLGATTPQIFATLSEMMLDEGYDRVAVYTEMLRVFGEFQIVRAIVGRDVDLIAQQTQALFGDSPDAMAWLAPLKAWEAYGRGDALGALDLLGEPRAGTHDELLVAMASERLGDIERAAPIYEQYARRLAGSGFGAMARARLRAMGREAGVITPEGRQLASALSGVPDWIDRMTSDPRSFMLLQAETTASTLGPNEPTLLRIRLRNTSAIPLGLGSSRPIGSHMLVSVRPISRLADFSGVPTPRVLELDRRLRLGPLEELEVVVEADSAYSSWLREVNAHLSMRDRYRLLQSFRPSPRGGLINPPLALVSESSIVQRVPLDLVRLDAAALEQAVRSGDPDDLRSALIATVARTVDPGDGLGLSAAERAGLARAWAERFRSAGDRERTLMLLRLPHARQVPEMAEFDTAALDTVLADAAAADPAGSVDAGLLVATMLTRVNDPENAVFELAARSPDPRVRRLGDRLRARLLAGEPAFANARPGAGGLAPPASLQSMGFGT